MNVDPLLMTASIAAQTTNVRFIAHNEILSHSWMKSILMKLFWSIGESQKIPGNEITMYLIYNNLVGLAFGRFPHSHANRLLSIVTILISQVRWIAMRLWRVLSKASPRVTRFCIATLSWMV